MGDAAGRGVHIHVLDNPDTLYFGRHQRHRHSAPPRGGVVALVLVLVLTFFIGLSCALLLSQAVRNSPTRNWTKNFNAVVIGAAYAIVVRLTVGLHHGN